MKLTRQQMQFIINCDVEQMVEFLQQDYKISLLQAFDTVYNSNTYQKLINGQTGMYLDSERCLYNYLQEELGQRNEYNNKLNNTLDKDNNPNPQG